MSIIRATMLGTGLATLVSRILQLASALRDYGVECNIVYPIEWQRLAGGRLGNILSVVVTHRIKDYVDTLGDPPDILFIGKTSTPQMRILQKYLKSKGKRIIFDLDDAIFLSDNRFLGINVRSGSFNLESILQNSDSVTVNGHYLLRYVQQYNEKVSIIHDPIDTELFKPVKRMLHEKLTIGWEGIPCNHYRNLSALLNPLKTLAREYDVKFKIVSGLGDPVVRYMFKELEDHLEIDYGLNHLVPMNRFPSLISDFDIMVAPLQASPWNEGKSALRVAMGMAMGIPVVASSVGEQKYVITNGSNGYLARNENEFYEYLRRLADDDDLRRKMGQAGRETAEKELSLKVNGRKLYSIMQKACAADENKHRY